MIAMKCPRCDQSAELPADLVDQTHQCYRCNVPLVIANPEVVAARNRVEERRYRSVAIGAAIGVFAVPLLGRFGGDFGIAVASGVVGALVGAVWGIIQGVIEGAGMFVMMGDTSWLPFLSKWYLLLGFVAGVFGGFVGKNDLWTILGIGALGGLVIGGMIGAVIGGALAERENLRRPEAGA